MPVILEERGKCEDYTVRADDTLESIAKAKCPDMPWEMLAQLNWGTHDKREVVRALCETVGVKVSDLRHWEKLAAPQKIVLKPDTELAPKLKIPKAWKKEGLAFKKLHTVKVKPMARPANAVNLFEVDKWFIPGEEACNIEYGLEGDAATADKLVVDVTGSHYCECSDWNDGFGTYNESSNVNDVVLWTKDLAAANQAEAREVYDMSADAVKWKGEVGTTATSGMLSRTTGTATARYINAAFSPYTVHFRYWKAEADKKARIVLKPFWPAWTEANSTPTATFNDTTKKVAWTNGADAERGVVVLKDKDGQRVHMEKITGDNLNSGAREITWNGTYRGDARNSKFGSSYLAADGAYVPTVTTVVRSYVTDTLKIKWDVKETDKLKRGVLKIVDGTGKVVFQKPLKPGLLVKKDGHELPWDGNYSADIKNSKNGTKAIPEDMPYRVEIEANGMDADKDEGLALAVTHTEVRLYVHAEDYGPKDILYDPWTAKASLDLRLAPLVAGDAPTKTTAKRKWYQHKLAEYGFHPGPIDGTDHDFYKIALKEFKRSVPKDHRTGGDYARLTIDENEDTDTDAAIEHIEADYKRKPFADVTRIDANNNDPDLTDDEIKQRLPNPGEDVVVWADDRQYFTENDPVKDETDTDFFDTGSPAKVKFRLANYRGGMEQADARTTLDAAAIPRPWIPLQAQPLIMSRERGLYEAPWPDAADDDTKKDALREKMRRLIGPLRVDWTFDELPPDVSRINPAHYQTALSGPPPAVLPARRTVTRSRTYVAWAIDQKKATHVRKDTGVAATYTNCRDDLGGVRPETSLADYYKKCFGYDDGTNDRSLAPWKAKAVSATESILTVVHEHIAASQTGKTTNLYETHLGAAGVWFVPSNIAGDGYRVRAELQFAKKTTDYEFPNLDALKARYPTLPQAHTARLRVWRRSSIRGYCLWSNTDPNHWPTHLVDFRRLYKGSHVYFVHEAGTAAQTFALNTVFDATEPTHEALYKDLVFNNVDADLQDKGVMTLSADYIWPWSGENNMGWRWVSKVDVAWGKIYDKFLDKILDDTWRAFRDALLLAFLRSVEKQGYLRGHFLVEFRSSPQMRIVKYLCGPGNPKHTYWRIKLNGAPSAAGGLCPATGCAQNAAAVETKTYSDGEMPCPAVGVALGATWLFTTSDAETWVHEVGHHRHLEHCATGPGAVADQHDSQANSTQTWYDPGDPVPPTPPSGPPPVEAEADARNWDRNCIMSYSSSEYGGRDYFCGKCLLRNRGWKVVALTGPGTGVYEPDP